MGKWLTYILKKVNCCRSYIPNQEIPARVKISCQPSWPCHPITPTNHPIQFGVPGQDPLSLAMFHVVRLMDVVLVYFAWCGHTNRSSIIFSTGLCEAFSWFFCWPFPPAVAFRLLVFWLATVELIGALRQIAVRHVAAPVVAGLGHVGEGQAPFVHLLDVLRSPALVCFQHLGHNEKWKPTCRHLPSCHSIHNVQ